MTLQEATVPVAADFVSEVPAQNPARNSSASRWSARIGCASLLLCFFALFWQRFLELGENWLNDDNYSHGFFVPMLSVWLVWRSLRLYGVPAVQSRRLGVVYLIAGSLLHWLAIVVWLPPVDFLALTTLLFGLALVIGGRRLAKQLQFPILFLFFMLPLPALLTDTAAVFLQGWVAGTAVYLMQAVIPVYQQGYVIYLPGHQLEVGEACSGLRQLIAFPALSLLLAHLSQRSWPYRLGLVLFAPVAALLANLLRVLLMAFVVQTIGPAWIEGAYHSGWGLLTLGLGLLLLVGMGNWLARVLGESRVSEEAKDAGQKSRPIAVAEWLRPKCLGAAPVILGLALLGQFGLQAHLAADSANEAPTLRESLETFPTEIGEWRMLPTKVSTQDYLQKADAAFNRSYATQGEASLSCQLFVVYYRDGTDREHHPLVCHKAAGFTEIREERESVAADGDAQPIERYVFVRNREKHTVYYWYYTFESPLAESPSFLQQLNPQRFKRPPSITMEVFTPAEKPAERAQVALFAQEVDRQIRESFLPVGTRRGNDALLIRLLPGTKSRRE